LDSFFFFGGGSSFAIVVPLSLEEGTVTSELQLVIKEQQ
jgi:hypothetical protein